jgi:hypothetical protein
MAFAVMRIAKIKSAGGAGGLSAHIERTMDVPNADKELESWNFRAAGTGNLWKDIQDKLEENKIEEVRKNGVYALEILMTASPEFFEDLRIVKESEIDYLKGNVKGTGKVMDFMWKSKSWIEKEFGENNLVSMKLHMDEKTPHIHAVVVPIVDGKNGKKKLSAKSFIDGRAVLRGLQDSFAEVHKESGLKRGLEGSKAKHTTVKDFYASIKNNPTLESETLKLVNQRSMKKETLTEQRLAKLESVVIEKFGWRPEWFEGQAVGTLHNVESEKKMREEKIEKDRLEKEAKIKEVQEREKQAENKKIERKIYRGPSM